MIEGANNLNRVIGYPNKSIKQFYYLLVILLLLTVGVGIVTPRFSVILLTQIILILAMAVFGMFLSYFRSRLFIIYLLIIWSSMPGIRRVSDWIMGEYQSISLLSIAPLLLTATIIFSLMHKKATYNNEQKKIIYCFIGAFIYAFAIGIISNRGSALYEMANYVIPFLLFIYSASLSKHEMKYRDIWISSLSTIAVFLSIYGWIQYFYLPEWDKLWMENVEMNSIGIAEPMNFRIFSTVNSPGPFALFLSIAIVPMIVEKKWRGIFGWVGVFIVLSALAISLVRSSWIFTIVAIMVYILFSRSIWRKVKYLGLITIVVIILINLVNLIPGAVQINERFATLGNLEEDTSFNARLNFAIETSKKILKNPLGNGFGSSGVSTKLSNNGNLGESGNFDNGILNVFYTFGWGGGFLFFTGLFLLFQMLRRKLVKIPSHQSYYQLGIAMIIALLISLLSFNSIPGMGGFLIWFIISMSFVEEEGGK
ncbi:Lipid A core - O-antigen ligase and related enzymes [Niallia circulans]|nr:Lipid A core - O-antigen ligase and related enzymes [Niallia circulans]